MNYRQKKKQEKRAALESQPAAPKNPKRSMARSGPTRFTVVDKGMVPEPPAPKKEEYISMANIATSAAIKNPQQQIAEPTPIPNDPKLIHYQLKKTEVDQKYFVAGDMSMLSDEDRVAILNTVDQLVKDPTIVEAKLPLKSGYIMVLHNIKE